MENWVEHHPPEPKTDWLELTAFPEQYRQPIEECRAEVQRIIGQTVPPELLEQVVSGITYEANAPTELNNQYGIKTVAICEHHGVIKIFNGFFEKSSVEQQYILTHEISHALANALFGNQKKFDQLTALAQSADVVGETKYVRQAMEKRAAGQLDNRAVLAEQTAERLTAYLLGGGDLVSSLGIQAAYMENPAQLFEGIPPELVADPSALRQFLADNPAPNQVIADGLEYQKLFSEAVDWATDEAFAWEEWEYGLLDSPELGSSVPLERYMTSSQERPSASEPLTLWRFLAELFLTSAT